MTLETVSFIKHPSVYQWQYKIVFNVLYRILVGNFDQIIYHLQVNI